MFTLPDRLKKKKTVDIGEVFSEAMSIQGMWKESPAQVLINVKERARITDVYGVLGFFFFLSSMRT